jgi:hypothetical protein
MKYLIKEVAVLVYILLHYAINREKYNGDVLSYNSEHTAESTHWQTDTTPQYV